MEDSQKRIALIDDDPLEARFMKRMLEGSPKVELHTYEDVPQFLARLESLSYWGVILDWHVGEYEFPYESIPVLRREGFEGFILLISALPEPDVVQTLTESGYDTLTKGYFGRDEIEAWLRRPRGS